MAIYFEFSDNSLQFGQLHVGTHPQINANLLNHWQKCISVQADRDELIAALALCNRTTLNRRVFTFVGHEAQTICANWR